MSQNEKLRRIFLCRHGKTEANEQGLFCGGKNDSPLNEEGKKQAMLLGIFLRNHYAFKGKFIITSGRQRAIETGQFIAKNLEPKPLEITMDDLRELDLGDWCGKKQEEIARTFPKEYNQWQKNVLKPTFRFPGGESMEEAGKRMIADFKLIKKGWLSDTSENNDDIIVIAHHGTNITIIASILNSKMKTYAYRAIRQDNSCVNIIGFYENPGWRPPTQILLVNGTYHLFLMNLL